MYFFKYFRYTSVPTINGSEDGEASSDFGSSASFFTKRHEPPSIPRRLSLSIYLICTANLVLFAISALMFVSGLRWQFGVDKQCFEVTNFYTPGLIHFDTSYRLVQFNGTVGWPSPYAPKDGIPTPEIDAAWDRFSARPMSVSEQDVLLSGETTAAVRLPKELGGGYLAWAEVNHQLHCLNLVRKAIYWDYYVNITHEFQRERFQTFAHLDHCIEMLRQVLMCNADAGIQLHHWVKGNPTPIPNSDTWHKCKDFESILGWTKERQITKWKGYLPVLEGSKIYEKQP